MWRLKQFKEEIDGCINWNHLLVWLCLYVPITGILRYSFRRWTSKLTWGSSWPFLDSSLLTPLIGAKRWTNMLMSPYSVGEQIRFCQIFVEALVNFPIFIIQSKNSTSIREYSESCHAIMTQLGIRLLLSNFGKKTAGWQVRSRSQLVLVPLTVLLYLLIHTKMRQIPAGVWNVKDRQSAIYLL